MLTLIGMLTANIFGRWLVRTGDRIVDRLPVVRSVYGTLKKILETVLAQSSRSFREVVLVEYPRRGIWVIGFITGATMGEVQNTIADDVVNDLPPRERGVGMVFQSYALYPHMTVYENMAFGLKLAKMANEMRHSVSGFTLPDAPDQA